MHKNLPIPEPGRVKGLIFDPNHCLEVPEDKENRQNVVKLPMTETFGTVAIKQGNTVDFGFRQTSQSLIKKRSYVEAQDLEPFAERVINPRHYYPCNSLTSVKSEMSPSESHNVLILSESSMQRSKVVGKECSWRTNG